MKAKELAEFLLEYPESEVRIVDYTTGEERPIGDEDAWAFGNSINGKVYLGAALKFHAVMPREGDPRQGQLVEYEGKEWLVWGRTGIADKYRLIGLLEETEADLEDIKVI